MKVTTVDYGRDGPVIDGKRLLRVTTYEGLAGERGTHEPSQAATSIAIHPPGTDGSIRVTEFSAGPVEYGAGGAGGFSGGRGATAALVTAGCGGSAWSGGHLQVPRSTQVKAQTAATQSQDGESQHLSGQRLDLAPKRSEGRKEHSVRFQSGSLLLLLAAASVLVLPPALRLFHSVDRQEGPPTDRQ